MRTAEATSISRPDYRITTGNGSILTLLRLNILYPNYDVDTAETRILQIKDEAPKYQIVCFLV